MDIQKAIDFLNNVIGIGFPVDCTIFPIDEEEKEVMITAISALEKQIPKKPNKKPDKYCDLIQIYYCPTCGRYFGQRGVHNSILFKKERFCQGENCGQAIDWNNE